jgi:putative membrane protein
VSSKLTREDGWHRLHPLSPITRMGRVVPVLAIWFVLSLDHSHRGQDSGEVYYVVGISILASILGFVHWLVTRWKIEGDTLRIETGLLRRDSRQLPLARIQAVDIVRPFMARLLGLSELRMRLAGSGSPDGKLAYLTEQAALDLRQRLLSGHQTVPAEGPEVPEHAMATVGTGRLMGSIVLSGVSVVLLLAVLGLFIESEVTPKAGASAAGVLGIYLFSLGATLWRRLTAQYHFEAVESADGVRIHRGLLQSVSETIPHGRIQAVRQIEPLLWRPFGWCRLEVDIAGTGGRKQRGEGTSVTRKALLPVGTHQDARHLIGRLLGDALPTLAQPPHRALYKAPLSYHFLASGHDDAHAVCVTGRLRKVTAWVPLVKSQSIRRVQGPVQRRLGLASVHVDVAGRRVEAEFRDRSVEEADRLVTELTDLSRRARLRLGDSLARPARPATATAPARSAPPGWYADPAGRHESRFWDGVGWTVQVTDGGARSDDAL